MVSKKDMGLLYAVKDNLDDFEYGNYLEQAVYNIVEIYQKVSHDYEMNLLDMMNNIFYECDHVLDDSDPSLDIVANYINPHLTLNSGIHTYQYSNTLSIDDRTKLLFKMVLFVLTCQNQKKLPRKVLRFERLMNNLLDEHKDYMTSLEECIAAVNPYYETESLESDLWPNPRAIDFLRERYEIVEATNSFDEETVKKVISRYRTVEEQLTVFEFIYNCCKDVGMLRFNSDWLPKMHDQISASEFVVTHTCDDESKDLIVSAYLHHLMLDDKNMEIKSLRKSYENECQIAESLREKIASQENEMQVMKEKLEFLEKERKTIDKGFAEAFSFANMLKWCQEQDEWETAKPVTDMVKDLMADAELKGQKKYRDKLNAVRLAIEKKNQTGVVNYIDEYNDHKQVVNIENMNNSNQQ